MFKHLQVSNALWLIESRLVIAAVVLVTKFYNDVFFSNKDLADAAGISLTDLNLIEKAFLTTLDYNLYISTDVFQSYASHILSHLTKMQTKTEETVDDGRSDIAVYEESLCCSDCEKD